LDILLIKRKTENADLLDSKAFFCSCQGFQAIILHFDQTGFRADESPYIFRREMGPAYPIFFILAAGNLRKNRTEIV
jgi:hypothetical protein